MDFELQEKVEGLSRDGYYADITGYIGKSWSIVTNNLGNFAGFTVLTGVIGMLLGLIPILGQIASLVISPILIAGYYIVTNKILKGEYYEFADFFKGFDQAAGVFIINLLSGVFILLGTICLIIPGIYLSVGLSLATAFLVLGKLDIWNAIKASVLIIHKKWFSFLGLFILMFLINCLGALCLLVGLLVTIPMTYVALAIAFEDIMKLNDDNESNIENHMIDWD